MPKNWKLQPEAPKEMQENLGDYPKFFKQLLYNRGLIESNQIEDFLNPKYENLNSPFLFLDMEKAVERIWKAIELDEKITIYGDYDADAVTANAVLQQTFKYLGVKVSSYIPDRFTEGYGINLEALQKIKDQGTTVIITVDCGTNSVDAAEFCKENNIDFIITDHHEIIGEKPDAFALINPKNPDDKYPYKEIVGVGVAFKLACGILERQEARGKSQDIGSTPNLLPPTSQKGWEKWLLDLVAIGTVADCHSLIGENRILVKYGLKVLAKTKWPGLRALIKTSGLSPEGAPREAALFVKEPDTYTLGFVLAPRLNAAGRLEHADGALNLLTSENLDEAMKLAQSLEEINSRRQDQTARILSEAREQVLLIQERKFLVVYGEGWNKGVVGLVAGRLAEEFYKPVVVMEKGESESTGSARTAGDFDLLESLKHASEHIHRFGGHKQAAGLTVKNENLEKFYQKVLEFAEANITEENSKRCLTLEAELDMTDLSLATCHLLLSLEPFGVDNFKPKFLIKNLVVSLTKLVGKESKHLQLKFKTPAGEISAIMFSAPDFAKNLQAGAQVDVAAELSEDSWNGRKELKLRVVDIRKD
jgi:single-stranded-DNA-specific exonuclease